MVGNSKKRTIDAASGAGEPSKRLKAGRNRKVKILGDAVSTTQHKDPIPDGEPPNDTTEASGKGTGAATGNLESSSAKPTRRIKKLAPPRPFPTVPTSVSATGPRSAHTEGKNMICLTRKTNLGAYMRRCKDVILKDGYKSLHLSAMGAAIPHLLHLALALPPILPFPADEIHTEILTGSVTVQDEVIPDDEDEDISYQTREKSTLMVIIKIGDGESEVQNAAPPVQAGHKGKGRGGGGKSSGKTDMRKEPQTKEQPRQVVVQEPEQADMYVD